MIYIIDPANCGDDDDVTIECFRALVQSRLPGVDVRLGSPGSEGDEFESIATVVAQAWDDHCQDHSQAFTRGEEVAP